MNGGWRPPPPGDLGFFLKFGYFFLINGRGDIGGKNIGKITKIVFTDFVKRSFEFSIFEKNGNGGKRAINMDVRVG